MKNEAFIFIIFLLLPIFSVIPINAQIYYHDFPPTPSYRYIHTQNGTIQAKSYYGTVNYKPTGLTIKGSVNATQNIYFNNLVAQQYINCGVGNYIYLLNTTVPGSFTCASIATAAKNATIDTMHNIGHGGQGFYAGNATATSFNFRNLTSIRPDLFTLTKNNTDVMIGSSFKINNSTCGSGKFVNQIGNHSTITCGTPSTSATSVTEDQVVFPRLTQLDRYIQPNTATSSSVGGTTAFVTLDTTANGTNGAAFSTNATQNISITIGTNQNRALIVGVSDRNSPTSGFVDSVKLGSLSFTEAVNLQDSGPADESSIWYLVNPPTGSKHITITPHNAGNGYWLIFGAYSFYNVIQTNPIGVTATNSGTSSPTSLNITPTHLHSIVLDNIQSNTVSVGDPQGLSDTVAWTAHTNGIDGASQYNLTPTLNGVHTFQWAIAGVQVGDGWLDSAIELIPSGTNQVANNAVDNNVTSYWVSTKQLNPWIYVDMGSQEDLSGMAIYWDASNTTETQVKFQTSNDSTIWNDKRTINTNVFIDKAWNYFRWNFDNGTERYVRMYGNSGANVTLGAYEIKISNPLANSIALRHGHLFINATDSTLPLSK